MARKVPYNLDAEASLLGALMLRPDLFQAISNAITVSDFYSPVNRIIYTALLSLYNHGQVIDAVTVGDEVARMGKIDAIGGPAALVDLTANVPSTSGASRYAGIIVEMANLRRIIDIANDAAERATGMVDDSIKLVEDMQAALTSIGVNLGDMPEGVWRLDDFLDRPDIEQAPWIIPGMFRAGWRVMVVAAEGLGKTVLMRQIAMAAAQGIHPLHYQQIPPVRSLIVDAENPEDSILEVCNPIRDRVSMAAKDYDPDRAWLWHKPAGFNLRRRPDRVALETIIAEVQPDLVCMGPLYKVYEVAANENDELAAREVMAVLDDLRTRYSFALMLEHHAPKETAGSRRKLMPYGSSFWLRWPEMGISLAPVDNDVQTLVVGRWRGDRLKNEWPVKLHRSDNWPWAGEWPDGTFDSRPSREVRSQGAPPQPSEPIPDDDDFPPF